MKRTFLIAALVSVVAHPVLAADPIVGMFKTQPGDDGNYAHVELYECGEAVCGVIRLAFDGSDAEIASDKIGKRMIWDMTADGGGRYSGGKIWAPDRDKTYSSKMQLIGERLKVSGCIAIICRDQIWTRVR